MTEEKEAFHYCDEVVVDRYRYRHYHRRIDGKVEVIDTHDRSILLLTLND